MGFGHYPRDHRGIVIIVAVAIGPRRQGRRPGPWSRMTGAWSSTNRTGPSCSRMRSITVQADRQNRAGACAPGRHRNRGRSRHGHSAGGPGLHPVSGPDALRVQPLVRSGCLPENLAVHPGYLRDDLRGGCNPGRSGDAMTGHGRRNTGADVFAKTPSPDPSPKTHEWLDEQ